VENQFMKNIKFIAVNSWISLSVCLLMSFYFAVIGPNFISQMIIEDENKNVQEIRSTTDLHQLQNIAAIHTEGEAYVMGCARAALIMAVATLVICCICNCINLWQLRRLKKILREQPDSPS
jgi:hypothetical protein